MKMRVRQLLFPRKKVCALKKLQSEERERCVIKIYAVAVDLQVTRLV